MLKCMVTTYSEVAKDDKRRMKLISRSATGEMLKAYDEHDVILVYKDDKLAGYCFISPDSPENHFDNEEDAKYVYNYICDSKYRKYKVSVFLMKVLKSYCAEYEINLDIAEWNAHSIRFFERNGFQYIGDYNKEQGKKEQYKSYTYSNKSQ